MPMKYTTAGFKGGGIMSDEERIYEQLVNDLEQARRENKILRDIAVSHGINPDAAIARRTADMNTGVPLSDDEDLPFS